MNSDKCRHCGKEENLQNLYSIEDKLIKNVIVFKKFFKMEEISAISPKFCTTCRKKWIDLGFKRGESVMEYLLELRSEMLNKDGTSISETAEKIEDKKYENVSTVCNDNEEETTKESSLLIYNKERPSEDNSTSTALNKCREMLHLKVDFSECCQCGQKFQIKNLYTVHNKLTHYSSKFRKIFHETKLPKFCKKCQIKWLQLNKLRGQKAENFIEKLKSEKHKDATNAIDEGTDSNTVNVPDSSVPGCSGIQGEIKTEGYNTISYVENSETENLHFNIEEDSQKSSKYWFQMWRNELATDEVGEEFYRKADFYCKKYKEVKRKEEEVKSNKDIFDDKKETIKENENVTSACFDKEKSSEEWFMLWRKLLATSRVGKEFCEEADYYCKKYKEALKKEESLLKKDKSE